MDKIINIFFNLFNFKKKPLNTVGLLNESTRVDWLSKTLKNIPAGSRILDAGAGEQQFKKFCTHLNYVSQDFAGYNPSELNNGLQMNNWDYGELDIISDIASIPEPDHSFDAIMCTEVFEHISNPIEAIKEFQRLLKPGGTLIITAPFCSLTHFAPYHYYTGFSSFFYEKELKNAGFSITEINRNGNYFEYLAQELRRLQTVASKYNQLNFSPKDSNNINSLLELLQNLTDSDTGSNELLCFGIHVLAIKR